MKRIFPVLLLVAGLAACNESTGPGPALSSLDISPGVPFTEVGDTARLAVTGIDEDGEEVTPRNVDFTSTNPAVARVDDDGVVTGVAVGTTTITAEGNGASDQVTVTVVAAGTLLRLNVNAEQQCADAIIKKGRIVATSQRAVFVEDVTNPSGSFTPAEYQAFAAEFDNVIYPTDVANFGAPSDIDNNGRVVVFYTRAVNELTPPGANFVVGGFFYARDLFPRTTTGNLGGCEGSNRSEIFYMLAVDPNGEVNGHVRSKDYVRESTIGTLAHEFQHLINASRRLYVNTSARFPEDVWLDEGLAHVAEELAFFVKGGVQPRQNLTFQQISGSATIANAFNEYSSANFARFREYMRDVEAQSPIEDDDDLGTRGSAWGFLRYAADRRGGNEQAFWNALVNATDTGYTNLQNRLGVDAQQWLRDWTVANYADDAVPAADARFKYLTYDMRSIYGGFGAYPLAVRTLANGGTSNATISASSAAYFRFAVAPGGTGDVRVAAGGSTEGGACTPVSLAVGGIYQGGNTPSALCLGAGEYVLIPYHASSSQTASTSISVSATGITAPVGPPSPTVTPLSSPVLSLTPRRQVSGDGGFHLRLRQRERDLGALVRRAGAEGGARRDVSSAPAAAAVVIQVLRTK